MGAYRDAGYHFICLSDHFEEEYGWRITDTRPFRGENFTTIVGAELSSAPWNDRDCYWVTAAGLPLDFAPPPPDDHAEAIRRAGDLGAFVVMLHPGLNNLPLAAAGGLPDLDAVEVYNHNCAIAATSDRAYGAYMLDGLLERGRKVLVNAGGDAHFGHPLDRFGGWAEVHCDRLDPGALVESLKAGRYYSTQGPAGDARGRRPFARSVERRLRDLADRGRRPVAERGGAHGRARRADHGGGVRLGPGPRIVLPSHGGRRGWETRLGQSGLAVRRDVGRRRTPSIAPGRSPTRRVERWPVSARTGPIAGDDLSEKTRVDQPPTPFAVVEGGAM